MSVERGDLVTVMVRTDPDTITGPFRGFVDDVAGGWFHVKGAGLPAVNYTPTSLGVWWIHGHPPLDSPEARALLVANALAKGT